MTVEDDFVSSGLFRVFDSSTEVDAWLVAVVIVAFGDEDTVVLPVRLGELEINVFEHLDKLGTTVELSFGNYFSHNVSP